MKYVLPIILAAVISGCSLFGPDSSFQLDNVWVTNTADSTIFVALMEDSVLHLIDPIPSFDPDDAPFPSIDPGTTRRFPIRDIEDFSRDDNLGMLVYVTADLTLGPLPGPPMAVFSKVVFVDNEDLREQKGHVVIEIP